MRVILSITGILSIVAIIAVASVVVREGQESPYGFPGIRRVFRNRRSGPATIPDAHELPRPQSAIPDTGDSIDSVPR